MAKLRVLGQDKTFDSHPLNQPTPLTVYANLDGFPTHVFRKGVLREVEEIVDRWRIDDEWWREKPISRMYFHLLLEGGVDLECFKDLEGGEWYEQRD